MGLVEEYSRQLKALLPVGRAWVREKGAKIIALLHGGAEELARCHRRFDKLLDEADPRSTLEMLPDWERHAGLPDRCSRSGETIRQRREALVTKLTVVLGQNLPFFQKLAARLRANVVISEYRPFTCGLSRLGKNRLNGPATCRFYWHVQVTEPRVTWFACGLSQCGTDPLARIDYAEELECWLNRLAPAHSKLIVGYGDDK